MFKLTVYVVLEDILVCDILWNRWTTWEAKHWVSISQQWNIFSGSQSDSSNSGPGEDVIQPGDMHCSHYTASKIIAVHVLLLTHYIIAW